MNRNRLRNVSEVYVSSKNSQVLGNNNNNNNNNGNSSGVCEYDRLNGYNPAKY